MSGTRGSGVLYLPYPTLQFSEEWARGRKLMACLTPNNIVQVDIQLIFEMVNTVFCLVQVTCL